MLLENNYVRAIADGINVVENEDIRTNVVRTNVI
jgi:hypothetical protein